MNPGLFGTTVVAAVLAVSPLAAAPAAAARPSSALTVPVTGAVDGGGTFDGSLTIQKFVAQDGALRALGTVTGTLTDAAGTRTSVFRTVSLPVKATAGDSAAAASASSERVTVSQVAVCGILHLDLGPLDLDLLGLVVHLDRVVLDISAEPGAGNLLGNLLCAIVGLLDGPGLLTQVANLLNQILSILG